jgi:hypothetical protein
MTRRREGPTKILCENSKKGREQKVVWEELREQGASSVSWKLIHRNRFPAHSYPSMKSWEWGPARIRFRPVREQEGRALQGEPARSSLFLVPWEDGEGGTLQPISERFLINLCSSPLPGPEGNCRRMLLRISFSFSFFL